MFEKRCNEMKLLIENELMKRLGVAFFVLSKQEKENLIIYELYECMKKQRERQD